MSIQNHCIVALILFSLLLVPVQSQERAPILNDAQTLADVRAYVRHEMLKHNPLDLELEKRVTILADILLPASDRALEIAKDDPAGRRAAYEMRYSAISNLMAAEIEGATQKLETFLDELVARGDADRNASIFYSGRFLLLRENVRQGRIPVENFEEFKSELKALLEHRFFSLSQLTPLGLQVAERHNIPAGELIAALVEFIQSPQSTLSEERKKEALASWETALRLAFGSDPKLYGKTLENEDFDWEKLRGKYVLIKFTATWCGPCKEEIPGLLEAYAKYHDKGFEIVSVYLDSVEAVRKHVEEEKLPWIIISGVLTTQANQPGHSTHYDIFGIPVMVLADKEGKIIMTRARGDALNVKLAEIFDAEHAEFR